MTDPLHPAAINDRRAESRLTASRVLAERCRLQARQALIEPAIGVPLITVVLTTLHPNVAADHLIPWAALLAATLLLRSVAAGRFLTRQRPGDADTDALTGVFNLTSGLSGLLIGAAAGLFFAQVDHAERLTLTVLIFAWLAVGVLLHAPFPRHALLHGGAVLAQLAVAWALAPDVPGTLIATGVLGYGALLARLSLVLNRALSQSMKRRHRIRHLARRLAQQRETAVRASRSASRFLAAASHDLRQPATSLGLLSTLVRERCTDATLLPLISAIDRSARSMSELLASLLDLSKLDSGTVKLQLEWLSVTDLFDSLREEFEPRTQEKGLALIVASAPVRVWADRLLLTRLLRNLLDNAVRFTDRGAITLTAAATDDGFMLHLTDTGVGIPTDQLDRIFEEHVRIPTPNRCSPAGLGLGLAMVRRIAELHDARVWAHSDGCQGSRFELAFPANRWVPDDSVSERASAPVAHEPASTSSAPEVSAARLDRPRLLLVDDDPEVARALSTLLDARGWQVDLASDAGEAFARLSAADHWQWLLTDYRLPGTADGISLALATRLIRPAVRCLVLSADTSVELQRRAADNGVELMHKPLCEEGLLATLRNRARPAAG